ncbi:hypothetical protein OROGR_030925 [Orobanche gracilis]
MSASSYAGVCPHMSSNPPFTSVELDHSDSGREGCTVTTLTVTAEPQNWRNAIKVAVQEVRRLKEFGVTNGELARYLGALLKDSEQLAAMIDNVTSLENLDFIMENDALGHIVMDQRQGHESLVALVGTVTLEEVNSIGAEVLEFLSDYGKSSAPPPAAIVACVPKKVHIDGVGETEFKIEPAEILAAIEAGLKEHIEAEPELEIPKELISSEQLQKLRLQTRPSFIPVDEENKRIKVYDEDTGIVQRRLSNGIPVNYRGTKDRVRNEIIRTKVGVTCIENKMRENRLRWFGHIKRREMGVPVRKLERWKEEEIMRGRGRPKQTWKSDMDLLVIEENLVVDRTKWRDRIYISKSEVNSGVMRLVVGGGRASEGTEGKGAVIVGVRTLSEAGCVGNFSREQVELFCVNHLINCSLESTEEFISMEFRFTLRDDGMRAAFQLLHMVLEHSVWLEDAFDRAKQLYLSFYRSIKKSLERSTAHKLMLAMLDGDERFVEPTPRSLQQLTLEQVKDAVMSQFVSDNMEVSIVGDFSEEDIESCILEYLGTIREIRSSERLQEYNPIIFRPYTADLQHQQVFLKDTDERACAYIAGPAPNCWGFTFEGKNHLEAVSRISAFGEHKKFVKFEDFERPGELENAEKSLQGKLRTHPLFFAVTLGMLQEIINSRLFTTVRDSLGLTYDVSFELNLFDRLKVGWYVISVTSTPEKVHKAVDACKNVLIGLRFNRIATSELDRARKDISCIKDMTSLYEAATVEDIYSAYEQLKTDENSLYSCIGIAGSQAGEAVAASLVEEEPVESLHNVIPVGRGSSTMTRPTT